MAHSTLATSLEAGEPGTLPPELLCRGRLLFLFLKQVELTEKASAEPQIP